MQEHGSIDRALVCSGVVDKAKHLERNNRVDITDHSNYCLVKIKRAEREQDIPLGFIFISFPRFLNPIRTAEKNKKQLNSFQVKPSVDCAPLSHKTASLPLR